jgi:hypothetical protein
MEGVGEKKNLIRVLPTNRLQTVRIGSVNNIEKKKRTTTSKRFFFLILISFFFLSSFFFLNDEDIK